MNCLVIYYSLSGSTREAAKAIAGAVNGELFEIREKGKRRGILGFIKSGFQASAGIGSRIEADLPDPGRYDAIFIGTPVWASNTSAAFNVLIRCWAGRTGDIPVHVFTLMADPRGNDKARAAVEKKLRNAGMRMGAYLWVHGITPGKGLTDARIGEIGTAAATWAVGAADGQGR